MIGYLYPVQFSPGGCLNRNWIKEQYDSFFFRRIRQRYIEIYGQLQSVEDMSLRKKLLDESDSLLDFLKI